MATGSLAELLRKYDGREIDVGLFGNVPEQAGQDVELVMAVISPDRPATAVTGKQKLLQRVWLELTTEPGSMVFAPLRGCRFFSSLRLNRPRTPADLLSLFSIAAEEIKGNLQAEELDSDPLDEKLQDVRAVEATLERNRVSLAIEIEAQDGGTIEFIAPIPLAL